jgi:hypothetical protein
MPVESPPDALLEYFTTLADDGRRDLVVLILAMDCHLPEKNKDWRIRYGIKLANLHPWSPPPLASCEGRSPGM